MHELVDFLVKQIIPSETYDIIILEDEDEIAIKVLVDKVQLPKLIGKYGRVVKSIRTIVKAAAQGQGHYDVVVEERDNG